MRLRRAATAILRASAWISSVSTHASCLFCAAIEVRTCSNCTQWWTISCQQRRSEPSCKIRALTHVLLVAAGATALSLDRRVALRAAAVAVACPSRPAKAVLACVDGQGPWCGGLEPATNDRAQSAEAVKKAYEAELAKLVTKRPPPEPSDSQDPKK